MTPSMTAWPPTSVSSPLSSTGSIWMCALKRRKLRIDKWRLLCHYIANVWCVRSEPGSYNGAMQVLLAGDHKFLLLELDPDFVASIAKQAGFEYRIEDGQRSMNL